MECHCLTQNQFYSNYSSDTFRSNFYRYQKHFFALFVFRHIFAPDNGS